MVILSFSPAAAKITLQDNDIHLWLTRPKKIADPNLLASYQLLLSADEKKRQQRYRFAKNRHNSLVTRAFVRCVLSQYADLQPTEWLFESGRHGKPEISNSSLPIRFNLSHTEGMVVCAVILDKGIGCDIESRSRIVDLKSIARRYFSASEVKTLLALPATQQQARFFEYWTLKEAYVKATGQGLSIPLDAFSFNIGRSEVEKYNDHIELNFEQESQGNTSENWFKCLFYPNDTHCVAVCVNGGLTHKSYKLSVFDGVPLRGFELVHCF